MKTIPNRFKQESTWRGIIALAAAFGIHFEPQFAEAIITVALALIGSINVVKNK